MSDPMAPIRAEVLAQPEADRVEYVLDLMAFYLDPVPAFFDGCRALGLALPNADMRMLHRLDKSRGRHVSLDALLAARCLDRPLDDWTTPEKAVQAIGAIRRRLDRLALPVQITTWRGVGYCLEAPADFRFEDAAARLRAVV